MKRLLPYLLILIFCLFFFSYRLTQVPQGLTIDESAFGYNAVLLSETLRDENGRFLPAFVLSIHGKDWRQPVTQYFMAAYFKIFGASIYNLRFTSVIITAISSALIFYLGNLLIKKKGGLLALLFFMTTPIIMIHSHMGLDNIMPIPFTLLWLIFLYLYKCPLSTRAQRGNPHPKNSKSEARISKPRIAKQSLLRGRQYLNSNVQNSKYLILSAISLGIGFYSYKGMRSFVPIWSVITVLYLVIDSLKLRAKKNLNKIIKPAVVFSLSILPFYVIIPLLEYKYAGAVLGQANVKIDSIYKFLLTYLASFDPSFLFITGDVMPHHSTGVHGMLLLASLPFFLVGIYHVVSYSVILEEAKATDRIPINLPKLIITSFFLGPILFGFPGSIHRASRLMALIPLYNLICAHGVVHLWERCKHPRGVPIKSGFPWGGSILATLIILLTINYFDFIKYYWYQYPLDTYHIFYHTEIGNAYEALKEKSTEKNLTVYVDNEILKREKETDQGVTDAFLRSIHFTQQPNPWTEQTKLPPNSILLTQNSNVTNLEKLEANIPSYFFHTN